MLCTEIGRRFSGGRVSGSMRRLASPARLPAATSTQKISCQGPINNMAPPMMGAVMGASIITCISMEKARAAVPTSQVSAMMARGVTEPAAAPSA